MGVGKTIQAIAAMSAFPEDWPLLVICPKVAVTTWKSECTRWLGKNKNSKKDTGQLLLTEDNVVILTCGTDQIPISDKKTPLVVICTYTLATTFVEARKLKQGMFKAVIVDESHNIKSIEAKRTQAIGPLVQSATRKILISGTPALNNEVELNSQISLLEPTEATTVAANKKYANAKNDTESMLIAIERRQLLCDIMVRRLKDEVLDLEPKERYIEEFEVDDQDVAALMHQHREGKGEIGRLLRLAADNSDDYNQASSTGTSSMFQLRHKTGLAKIPYIHGKLKEWLSNKIGKICIFAHHKDVLDALEKGGESLTLWIRTRNVAMHVLTFLKSFLTPQLKRTRQFESMGASHLIVIDNRESKCFRMK